VLVAAAGKLAKQKEECRNLPDVGKLVCQHACHHVQLIMTSQCR
jgi:hypothetical protein